MTVEIEQVGKELERADAVSVRRCPEHACRAKAFLSCDACEEGLCLACENADVEDALRFIRDHQGCLVDNQCRECGEDACVAH